jgi:serine/threonine protein kinase
MTDVIPAGDPTTADAPGRFVPPAPAELAARLPHLEISEILGHGGMGVVYKGRQPLLDRTVAVKVIRPDFGGDEDARRRFLQEARALARLTHPYVVSVYDCGLAGDLVYFVMEYVAGTTLRRRLSGKAVSQRDVLDFLPQVGEALQHAHEQGVVHRDVKPENILVDSRNRVRLVDFGLARWLPAGRDRSAEPDPDAGRVAGTWGYMAPEQFAAPETVDHRADVFAAGVVCHEMLTGKLPAGVRQPPSAHGNADPRFDPIVLRAIEPDRDRRYQQMRDMNADVVALTRTAESTIVLTRTIPAAVDRVFAAWTEPARMHEWYAPTDDYTTPLAEAEPKVGGSYKVGMHRKELNVVSGQFCRVEPPRLLSFTWAWESPRADVQETQVTLDFRPVPGGTELTLTHERFRDEQLRKDHAQGWAGCLERLARKVRA